jgi:integrase
MLHFGSRRLATITQSDLDAAAKKLFPSAKPETLTRQCYAPFIAVWNHAVRNEWAKERKWQRPRKLKGTAQRQEIGRAGQRPVTYERAWQFVEAASPAAAMVMTALFYTGMRPIELFGLLREDVDVAGRWIVVHASKTGEPRGVPMHEMLAPLFEALHKQPKPTGKNQPDAVFRTHKGQPYPMLQNGGGQLKSAILGARGRLGKEAPADISPYTARHTVSTQLVVAGVHPYIKDQILGHAADDMSRHYTNIPQKPLLEAINSLPVIPAWRDAAWLHDPLEFRNKLTRYVNHGRRGNPKDEPAEPAKEQTFSVRS